MQKMRILLWAGLLVGMLFIKAEADIEANKRECQAKCEAAAEMIKTQGLAPAICEINRKTGRFVNGQIFVYMMNMDAVMMAHPMVPDLIGKNLSGVVLKDKAGKSHPMMLVNLAKNNGAGWVSYMWPKPGTQTPAEKMCFVLKVPDTNVFLVAGFYKD